MALTCEIMKVDNLFVCYECAGKLFPTYEKAYFYGKNLPVSTKTVFYVFTPTMQKYKRVSELENAYRMYCKKTTGCDYFDFINNFGVTQLNLIGEM